MNITTIKDKNFLNKRCLFESIFLEKKGIISCLIVLSLMSFLPIENILFILEPWLEKIPFLMPNISFAPKEPLSFNKDFLISYLIIIQIFGICMVIFGIISAFFDTRAVSLIENKNALLLLFNGTFTLSVFLLLGWFIFFDMRIDDVDKFLLATKIRFMWFSFIMRWGVAVGFFMTFTFYICAIKKIIFNIKKLSIRFRKEK